MFNLRELVDECIEDELDEFNENLENYTVPSNLCDDYIPDSSLTRSGTKGEIIEDVREKLECLHASYDLSHTYEKFSIQGVLRDYFEVFKSCAISLPDPFVDTFNGVRYGLENCTSYFNNFQLSFVDTIKNRVDSCLNSFSADELTPDEQFAVDVVLPTAWDESVDNLAEIFTALLMDLKKSGVSLDNIQMAMSNATDNGDVVAKDAISEIVGCFGNFFTGDSTKCVEGIFDNAVSKVAQGLVDAVNIVSNNAFGKAVDALTKVDNVIKNCFNVTEIGDSISGAFDDMTTAFETLGYCFTEDTGLRGSISAIAEFPDRALTTFSECASGFTVVTDELLEIPRKTFTAFDKCTLSGMYPKSPIFAAKANAFGSFNYETPVELIEYKKRMKPGKRDKKYGKLAIDTIPEYLLFDTVAEAFMFDVYEEFIGCAVRPFSYFHFWHEHIILDAYILHSLTGGHWFLLRP